VGMTRSPRLSTSKSPRLKMVRHHKFFAKVTYVDGHRFASKLEASWYKEYKNKESLGIISGLRLQPSYDIIINGTKVCKVILDFEFIEDGVLTTVDVKGMDTPISKLKRKLVKAAHNVDVVIVK